MAMQPNNPNLSQSMRQEGLSLDNVPQEILQIGGDFDSGSFGYEQTIKQPNTIRRANIHFHQNNTQMNFYKQGPNLPVMGNMTESIDSTQGYATSAMGVHEKQQKSKGSRNRNYIQGGLYPNIIYPVQGGHRNIPQTGQFHENSIQGKNSSRSTFKKY